MSEARADQAPVSMVGPAMEDDARTLAAKLVNALYRLIKGCQLHAETNQAIVQIVDYLVAAIEQYAERANVQAASILFTPHAVFVNRQILRASRETYQLAIELGALLEPCGVTEITLDRNVAPKELAEFGRIVADFVQEGKKSKRFEGGWETLKLRRVVGLGGGGSENLPPPVHAARTYAAALMIVRGFYADIRKGKYELRQGIKRVAQKLVSQFDVRPVSTPARLLLSIAATPSADADRTNVILSSSIIALAMANQLTNDRALLTGLTSAALLYDSGRQRLIGHETENPEEGAMPRGPRTLNVDQEQLVPISSVVALTALGKLHPPNLVRTVIVHESQAIRDGGTVYQNRRSPLLLSRILTTARAFTDLRVPRPGAMALGIDETLQVLESQASDNVGRALVKLLTGSLGIFPAGTMVELSTGEMGVVLSTPLLAVDFARPPVRILYDQDAQLLAEPIDVDLADPSATTEHGRKRFIKRPIDATDQQMKQMRAYVMQLSAKRSSTHSKRAAVNPMSASTPSSSSANNPFSSSVSAHSQQSAHSAQSAQSAQSAPSAQSANPLSAHSHPSHSHSAAPQSAHSAQGYSSPARSNTYSSRPSLTGPFPPTSHPLSSIPSARPSAPYSSSKSGEPLSYGSENLGRSSSGRESFRVESPRVPAPSSSPSRAREETPSPASVRPSTRRWDPRSEEEAAAAAAAAIPASNVPSPRINAPSPLGAPGPAIGSATRSVSWQQYGRELATSTGQPVPATPVGPGVPPVSSTGVTTEMASVLPDLVEEAGPVSPQQTETDAILAAYLAEDGSGMAARSSASGVDPVSQAEAGRSFGLRWTGTGRNPLDTPSTASGSARGSSGREHDSAGGSPSNAGLRWGADKSRGRDQLNDTSPPAPTTTPSVAAAAIPTPLAPTMPKRVHKTQAPTMELPAAKVAELIATPPTSMPAIPRSTLTPQRPLGPMSTPAPPVSTPHSTLRSNRTAGASAWAAKPKREDELAAKEAPQAIDKPPDEPEPAPMDQGATSRRAKAGASNWGASRRDGKK